MFPQRITLLPSLSGHEFEEGVEKALGSHFRTVQYAARASQDHDRPDNDREVVTEARNLMPGKAVLLLQPRQSDRTYLLASCEFLLDPRRLTVALSRAKRKMIQVRISMKRATS